MEPITSLVTNPIVNKMVFPSLINMNAPSKTLRLWLKKGTFLDFGGS